MTIIKTPGARILINLNFFSIFFNFFISASISINYKDVLLKKPGIFEKNI